jgi:hypothetical protein
MEEKQPMTGKEFVERKVALDGMGCFGCLSFLLVPVAGIAIYYGWFNPWIIGSAIAVTALYVFFGKRALSNRPLDKD